VAPVTLDVPPFVSFIIHRLNAAGYETYVVGGAVRDALLGRSILDWDVGTAASAERIRSIFRDQRQFSIRHGTVTMVHSGAHFEVTPFRGPGNDLVSDLSRRDFTINAMAFDPEQSEVIDPFCGKKDLKQRILRAVGSPEERFREDPLRLLRCIRLSADLRFCIEKETLGGLSGTAPLLSSVASERVRDELIKILMTHRPSPYFYLMARTGVLKSFLPELLEGYLKRQNHYHRYTIFRHIVETVDYVREDPLLRVTALLHDIGKPRTRIKKEGTWRFYGHEKESARMAEEILKRLRFSREITQKASHLIRHHMIGYSSAWSDAAIRRLIQRVGPGRITDLLELRRADLMAHGLGDQHLNLLEELERRVEEEMRQGPPLQRRELAVDGNTVMRVAGLLPGPEVGKILQHLNEKVLDHPELNNPEDLTALIQSMGTSA